MLDEEFRFHGDQRTIRLILATYDPIGPETIERFRHAVSRADGVGAIKMQQVEALIAGEAIYCPTASDAISNAWRAAVEQNGITDITNQDMEDPDSLGAKLKRQLPDLGNRLQQVERILAEERKVPGHADLAGFAIEEIVGSKLSPHVSVAAAHAGARESIAIPPALSDRMTMRMERDATGNYYYGGRAVTAHDANKSMCGILTLLMRSESGKQGLIKLYRDLNAGTLPGEQDGTRIPNSYRVSRDAATVGVVLLLTDKLCGMESGRMEIKSAGRARCTKLAKELASATAPAHRAGSLDECSFRERPCGMTSHANPARDDLDTARHAILLLLDAAAGDHATKWLAEDALRLMATSAVIALPSDYVPGMQRTDETRVISYRNPLCVTKGKFKEALAVLKEEEKITKTPLLPRGARCTITQLGRDEWKGEWSRLAITLQPDVMPSGVYRPTYSGRAGTGGLSGGSR